jgi:ubiquitin-like 1-activating enzyme E1 A
VYATLNTAPVLLHSHVATLSTHEFSPTAAILGGLLAQDILRTLSRKEKPVMNFSVIHTMEGVGAVSRWGVSGDE